MIDLEGECSIGGDGLYKRLNDLLAKLEAK